jgi:hypothetical protein
MECKLLSTLSEPQKTNFSECFSVDGWIVKDFLRVQLKMSEKHFQSCLETISKNIEQDEWQGVDYVRAINNEYVPYTGPYDIFCISHTTFACLGAVHLHRPVNILTIPERCENKGVKAYISLKKCHDILFWSKKSDLYQNKIYCFDSRLRENFFFVEYVSDYNSSERIEKFKLRQINNLITMFSISKEEAIARIKRLFIADD